MKLLIRLRVRFHHLNGHKFQHNFQDIVCPLWNWKTSLSQQLNFFFIALNLPLKDRRKQYSINTFYECEHQFFNENLTLFYSKIWQLLMLNFYSSSYILPGPSLDIRVMGALFGAHFLNKKVTFLACTPWTDLIFYHFSWKYFFKTPGTGLGEIAVL